MRQKQLHGLEKPELLTGEHKKQRRKQHTRYSKHIHAFAQSRRQSRSFTRGIWKKNDCRERRPEKQNRSVNLRHLVMTEDKLAKRKILTVKMDKADHNHHTKKDNMTLNLIQDNETTITQTGLTARYARIAKELITLLKNVKRVLIVLKLDISVMSAAPRGQVI